MALAARTLGEAFLTRRTEAALARFASRYPDHATGHILECDLHALAGTADYSLALLPGPPDSAEMPVPAQLAPLLRDFREGALPASVLWLEHDMAADGDLSAPSVFLTPAPGSDAAEVARALCGAVWPGRPCPDPSSVAGILPEGAFLKQIGAMAGRGDDLSEPSLRLVIDGITPNDVMPLLERLGWPGSLTLAEEIIALAARHLSGRPCRVDLDIGQVLAPTLGVELPASQVTSVPALAADLRTRDLCSDPKAIALIFLAPRRSLCTRDTPNPTERLDFGLNHVKLSISIGNVDQDTNAKAYFSLVTTPDFPG